MCSLVTRYDVRIHGVLYSLRVSHQTWLRLECRFQGVAHIIRPSSILGGCICYELVNLSLSYDSNLCVNYQAKSSSTEIQVKATISYDVNLLIEVECGRGRLELDNRT